MLTKVLKDVMELKEMREELERQLTPEEREKWNEYKKIKDIFVTMDKKTRAASIECLKDVHEFLTLKEALIEFWDENEKEF